MQITCIRLLVSLFVKCLESNALSDPSVSPVKNGKEAHLEGFEESQKDAERKRFEANANFQNNESGIFTFCKFTEIFEIGVIREEDKTEGQETTERTQALRSYSMSRKYTFIFENFRKESKRRLINQGKNTNREMTVYENDVGFITKFELFILELTS